MFLNGSSNAEVSSTEYYISHRALRPFFTPVTLPAHFLVGVLVQRHSFVLGEGNILTKLLLFNGMSSN